jgi:hypothetical protein
MPLPPQMTAEPHILRSRATGQLQLAAASLALAMIVGTLFVWISGAWTAGFSGADEPAHFLNSYFIAEYLRTGFGSNPLAFATEFYLHYPKISVGHWPPGYYGLLSPFFLLFPATPQTAFVLNLILAAAPAMLAGLLAARLLSRTLALAAALLTALTPIALEAFAFFMLDQAVAAAALGTTLLWIAHAHRPAAWKMLAVALLSAFAVLIKGNGWLLLFVPPLHILLTGRWRLLASPWPWAAGLLAGLIVGPWYWLTAGISADGFNYSPGPAYAAKALWYDLSALAGNLTIPGLLLAGYGAVAEWRARREAPDRWNVIAGCLALILATLLLQSLVPVDLDPRYMAPAVPPLVVLALAGAVRALPRHRNLAAAAAALLLASPGLLHAATREPKIGFRAEEVAAQVRHPSAWVIDGTSGAEGAYVAAMAVRDPDLRSYAVRSSRLLAESDFMGSEYALTTNSPAEVVRQLRGLGIDGIVISRIGGEDAFPHSGLLRQAVRTPGSGYRLVAALPHRGRPGITEIYRAVGPQRLNEAEIRALGLPQKAQAVAP